VPIGSSAKTSGTCKNRKRRNPDGKYLKKIPRKKFKKGSKRDLTNLNYTMKETQKY